LESWNGLTESRGARFLVEIRRGGNCNDVHKNS